LINAKLLENEQEIRDIIFNPEYLLFDSNYDYDKWNAEDGQVEVIDIDKQIYFFESHF
jgi:hypothetical protein